MDSGIPSDRLCLLGTWRFSDDDFERIASFIDEHHGRAVWWTFRIKDEAREKLQTPFWLYLNRGANQLVARYSVSDYKTGQSPMMSPWPERTEVEDRDKDRSGPEPHEGFRTWLLVDAIEKLDPPLTIADFEPADGLSHERNLLNQSIFGYAFRKGACAAEPLPESSARPHLNTILYGPPGTSKTYETVNRALEILDPSFLGRHFGDRLRLKARYDELRQYGRIGFVTFHQSYSYEDFVEGIKPDLENGEVGYVIEDGIFKQMCRAAASPGGDQAFRKALHEFKRQIAEEPVTLETKTGKKFKITWRGGKTLRFTPASSDGKADYPVNAEHIERLYRGEPGDGFYNVSYVRAVEAHVRQKWNVPQFQSGASHEPYVLIIDEINRGNIASIFGELITLIEPSKRAGAPEALSATLPYSKYLEPPFWVPSNLFLIGTMNTADRSLSRLDTALRRRFDFVPMYPRPELLDGIVVAGIDLAALLRRMNERIEVLYDRDHQLGHAFFTHLRENGTLPALKEVFRSRIIPLLEEYFFEDWQKIRLVLGDNQKKDRRHQFIVAEAGKEIDGLFGGGDEAPETSQVVRYRRNEAALDDPEAYRQVYGC